MKETIATAVGSIAFEENGSGKALVFVHGNSSSSRSFAQQLAQLPEGVGRLIAIDLPGHGDSVRLPAYGVPGLVDALVETCAALQVQEPILVGHSLGGHIALEAMPRIRHARGLLVFGTPPLGRPIRFMDAFHEEPALAVGFKAAVHDAEVSAFVQAMFGDPSIAPGHLAEDFRQTDGRMRVGLGESLAAGQVANEVAVIHDLAVPVAILHGAKERVARLPYLASLSIPMLWRRRIHVLDGVGHYAHIEAPAAFNELLMQFVADCRRSNPDRSPG
jgi:pimeloyl-ACP methyl ester carboxylesterase